MTEDYYFLYPSAKRIPANSFRGLLVRMTCNPGVCHEWYSRFGCRTFVNKFVWYFCRSEYHNVPAVVEAFVKIWT